MILKCLRLNDKRLDVNKTFNLNINLEQFYVKNEYVDVEKVLDSDYLFEPYYDSLIIKTFSKIYVENRFDIGDIQIAEALQGYYRLLVVFFTLLEFIKKSHIPFNKNVALEEGFIFTGKIPNVITAKHAYYYLYLLILILSLRNDVRSASDFYSDDYLLPNGKYIFEDDYDERIINILHNVSPDIILDIFEQTNKEIAGKKNRCVALLIYHNKKYLSISGTSQDYDGDIINRWMIGNDYKNVYKYIKTDIINYDCACHLIDTCCGPINYGFYKNDIVSIKRMIQHDYACCERKILAYIPSPFIANDAQLFVKFIPCEKCIPYLDGMKDIVCCYDLNGFKKYYKSRDELRKALKRCSISKGIVYIQQYDEPDCFIE